ncbi:MAG: hypothetical protein BGO41_15780 [Clostridiales bacterium 38-18]|nr:MAG: hypothetical protein BGO41_15780 [Clostridiales bacterium 38-18]
MAFNGTVKILNTEQHDHENFSLSVAIPETVKPGQFFNFLATDSGMPLLRRPISVSGIEDNVITFTIKVVGKGTQYLANLKSGDEVALTGPLGNGFDLTTTKKRTLLIGGGIGVAPIKGLGEALRSMDIIVDSVIGFRENPILEAAFLKFSTQLTVVSEKNDTYKKGYVTQYLEQILDENEYDEIYACGPKVMLRAVTDMLNSRGKRAQLLMEEKMACGIGACLVCTCKLKDGEFGSKMVRMCKEGPMFYSDEVIFDE